MYIPSIYQNTNIEEVREFIHAHGFGILVSHDGRMPVATHIPLLLIAKGEKYVLSGHISKANAQWKHLNPDDIVLSIFNGPHAYISSSWYDHKNVPTWNYISVHVYGRIKLIQGEELYDHLESLMQKYEGDAPNAVKMSHLSPDFVKAHIRGVVGIEIEIEEIQAAQKLSQNRDEKNYKSIIGELKKSSDPEAHEIAKEMTKKMDTLFNK
jgi:transcriptional regulator